jgi:anaerobic magnesium-protoporphyrin IX monomethyl ester cyclase
VKLLLTHAYFIHEDEKEQTIVKPYAPLGILYLSSHLREKGFDVDIYDSTFGSKHELFRLLSEDPPGALGIYANLMTRGNAVEIAKHAQECGWTVILGGPEPANYPDEYLAHGADVVVAGEGELALEALLRTNCRPEHFASIDGIYYRTAKGQVVRTSPGRLIANLDAQPWPDRDRICLEKYLSAWRTRHGTGSVSLITARGCPYHCNWCSHSVYGQTHRRRSPKPVVDEVAWILDRYNPEMLWLADDVFTIHHGWLFEYAKEMKARNLVTPFECITRADRLNERVADTLAELKCFRVWIGSESGSQQILNAMQRGVTVEQVQRAVALCKARGIQTGMFLMWGYEGERVEDVEATVDHVKTCRPDVFFTTVSYPIKGTPSFERVSDRLVRIEDWARSTDRDFKIQGRHSRNFYKNADRLLKSEMADAEDVPMARAALYDSALEVEA